MDILKRFERYVTIETTSDEASDTAPSTAIQLNLAKVLEQELKEIGVPKVMLDEYGIAYGWLPASEGLEKVLLHIWTQHRPLPGRMLRFVIMRITTAKMSG